MTLIGQRQLLNLPFFAEKTYLDIFLLRMLCFFRKLPVSWLAKVRIRFDTKRIDFK